MIQPKRWLLALMGVAGAWAAEDPPELRYVRPSEVTQATARLAELHPELCRRVPLGTTRGGRTLWALDIGLDDDPNRPAVAIVAGIDGDDPAGTVVALHIADRLLHLSADEDGYALLRQSRFYIIPVLNADAQQAFFDVPQRVVSQVPRPIDNDRDGAVDEDGPEDIDGDGRILQMRVPLIDRALDDHPATHIVDPVEPRLLKAADAAKGEVAAYAVFVEGLDNDGDGQFNEDGPGGVLLNHNFPTGYIEHAPDGGPHAVSEPETRALIDFFLQHPRIAAAIFYGRGDNIANKPKEAGRGSGGGPAEGAAGGGPDAGGSGRRGRPQEVVGLHGDDVAIYGFVGERYRELTGIKSAPQESGAGAAHTWSYGEYGVPTFACRIWTRPVAEGAAEADPAEPKVDDRSGEAAGAPSVDPELDASDEPQGESGAPPGPVPPAAPAAPAPHDEDPGVADEGAAPSDDPVAPAADDTSGATSEEAAGSVAGRGSRSKDDKTPKPADAEAAAWLKYSDEQRDGVGFIDWKPFDHPQLGAVELGGFVPFFREAPPEPLLGELAVAQWAFVCDVAGRLPALRLEPLTVTQLAPQVFEIRTAVVNDGYFPSAMGIATVNRRVRPVVVRLEWPMTDILGGERVQRIWKIAGSGGRHVLRWIVQGTPDSAVRVTMQSEKYGTWSAAATLPSAPPTEDTP